MKFRKNTNTTTNTTTQETKNKSLGKVIKADVIKLLWLMLYVGTIVIILTACYSFLPGFFAYMYSSIGVLLGIDFNNTNVAELQFWNMCGLSTGAVFVFVIIMFLKAILSKLTNAIVRKHVFNK